MHCSLGSLDFTIDGLSVPIARPSITVHTTCSVICYEDFNGERVSNMDFTNSDRKDDDMSSFSI